MNSNKKYLSSVWTHATEACIERGEGAYLFDTAGKKYLDFTCGIGVTNTGHCHPKVVQAVREQAGRLLFGQLNIVLHRPLFDLMEELSTILPKELDQYFFSNSGAEAVEGAVKLAKQVTGRPNIIVFHGSFHGRTHLTMAMTTSKTVYRARYQPLVPGIFTAPYPYSYYYGWDDTVTLNFAVKELKRLLKSQTAPEETACIVVEPVLGEGGYVVPPAGFLQQLRKICDDHGILLVADEIQSGFGRTGEFFAVQHEGVVPDIMTMAKGIASGMALSCIAYKKDFASKWIPGSHGGTFGGNPVACAAGAATIRVIKEEKLHINARERGKQLLQGLRMIQQTYPVIGDVRGIGCMAATEFTRNGNPDGETAKKAASMAARKNLLLLTCGTCGNVVRWIPPLIVKSEEIDNALGIFEEVLSEIRTD